MEQRTGPPAWATQESRRYLPTIAVTESEEGVVLGPRRSKLLPIVLGIVLVFSIVVLATNIFALFAFFMSQGAEMGGDFLSLFIAAMRSQMPCLVVALLSGSYFLRRRWLATHYGTPTLTVRQWPLALGSTTEIIYRRPQRPTRGEALQATLYCVEHVTYKRGKGTATATHDVLRHPLAVMESYHAEAVEARWTIHIPPTLPPSFDDNYRNKIM